MRLRWIALAALGIGAAGAACLRGRGVSPSDSRRVPHRLHRPKGALEAFEGCLLRIEELRRQRSG